MPNVRQKNMKNETTSLPNGLFSIRKVTMLGRWEKAEYIGIRVYRSVGNTSATAQAWTFWTKECTHRGKTLGDLLWKTKRKEFCIIAWRFIQKAVQG